MHMHVGKCAKTYSTLISLCKKTSLVIVGKGRKTTDLPTKFLLKADCIRQLV